MLHVRIGGRFIPYYTGAVSKVQNLNLWGVSTRVGATPNPTLACTTTVSYTLQYGIILVESSEMEPPSVQERR